MISTIIFKILSWSQYIPNKGNISPPFSIEQFLEWHKPIRGNANPQLMSNPIWKWLIETGEWPYSIHEALGIKKKDSPIWCFSRYGQSETLLADGSIIYIGGEHEDSYDEDFYIYNDVIIVRPTGKVEVFGYPTDVFPPTDFHSATLYKDKIYIIGALGYADQNTHMNTQVHTLDINDLSIKTVRTKGIGPKHLWKHKAILSEEDKVIICSGGKVSDGSADNYIENTDKWAFHIGSCSWEKI